MSLYREYITANVVLERKPNFYHFCQKKKKGNQTTTLIIFLNQNLRFGSRTVSWKERIISIIIDYPIFPNPQLQIKVINMPIRKSKEKISCFIRKGSKLIPYEDS